MDSIVILIIVAFLSCMTLCLQVGMAKQHQKMQLKVGAHNRGVRLGLYANNESIDSKADCFASDSFLRLHNGGTVDVTFLQDCEYVNLIPFETNDLFLRE